MTTSHNQEDSTMKATMKRIALRLLVRALDNAGRQSRPMRTNR